MAKIAIHQPNFFPWLGYFAKMAAVDIFVFLDNAQIQKTGGSWSNRTLVGFHAPARWFTAPIDKESKKTGDLRDVTFADTTWREQASKMLGLEYKKLPFFGEEKEFCIELLNNKTNNLVEYNSTSIMSFANRFLPKPPKFVFSSDLGVNSTGTERLVEICTILDGTEYFFGGGAQNYQEDHLFYEQGITPVPLAYSQPEAFKPKGETQGLSVIDSTFRLGEAEIMRHLQFWNEK